MTNIQKIKNKLKTVRIKNNFVEEQSSCVVIGFPCSPSKGSPAPQQLSSNTAPLLSSPIQVEKKESKLNSFKKYKKSVYPFQSIRLRTDISGGKRARHIASVICKQMKEDYKKKNGSKSRFSDSLYTQALEIIVLNNIRSIATPLRVLRRQNNILDNTIDYLIDIGYFHCKRGYKFVDSHASRTMLTPTNKWNNFLVTMPQINQIKHEIKIPRVCPVILRDKDKKKTEFEITTEIQRLIDFQNALDNHIKKFDIRYISNKDGRTHKINHTQSYRVFNDDSFDKGGRIYLGHQKLRQVERKTVTINKKKTVELDYKSLAITQLYDYTCQELTFDPYFVPGIDREIIKGSIVRLLGCKQKRGISSIEKFLWEEGSSLSAKFLYDTIYKLHSKVSEFFECGTALKLQCLDGKMAQHVCQVFIDKNLPIIPIHDSFITTEENEELLLETMIFVYQRTMLTDRKIDIEKK